MTHYINIRASSWIILRTGTVGETGWNTEPPWGAKWNRCKPNPCGRWRPRNLSANHRFPNFPPIHWLKKKSLLLMVESTCPTCFSYLIPSFLIVEGIKYINVCLQNRFWGCSWWIPKNPLCSRTLVWPLSPKKAARLIQLITFTCSERGTDGTVGS